MRYALLTMVLFVAACQTTTPCYEENLQPMSEMTENK